IQFNLSHSFDQVIYALCLDAPIGVDIEKIKPTFNMAIARRYFSEQEITYLEVSEDGSKNERFYQIWSRKEAFVKAIGDASSIPIQSISIPCDTVLKTFQYMEEEWSVVPLHLAAHYAAVLISKIKMPLITTFTKLW